MLDTFGNAPPKQLELPKGLKDDLAVTNPAASDKCPCRLTLAKDFSLAPLFAKASGSPHLLPALLLGEHRQDVLQARGAVAYSTEVTCLINIPNSKAESLLKVSLPDSGLCSKHRSGEVPQWITSDKNEPAIGYFNKALGRAQEAKARLLYRPSTTALLGLVGCATTLRKHGF